MISWVSLIATPSRTNRPWPLVRHSLEKVDVDNDDETQRCILPRIGVDVVPSPQLVIPTCDELRGPPCCDEHGEASLPRYRYVSIWVGTIVTDDGTVVANLPHFRRRQK